MSKSDKELAELIGQIPVMNEKIDRILHTLDKIAETNTLLGLKRGEDAEESDPLEFDLAQFEMDTEMMEEIRRKREASRKLAAEADELESTLGLGG